MPLNLAQNPLSSLKIGESNVLKGIVGINEIYPNETDITAAAFTNAGSTIANTGGNESYVVSGEVGATFSLQGSAGATPPSGTQTLAVSPTTYQVAIGDQSAVCGSVQRNPTVTIAAQGTSVFNPVNLQTTSSVIQSAGPSYTSNATVVNISVTNSVRQTITVGSQLRWAAGSVFNVSFSFTTANNSAISSVVLQNNLGSTQTASDNGIVPQTWSSGADPSNLIWSSGNASLDGITSGSALFTMDVSAPSIASFVCSLILTNKDCFQASQTTNSATLFP